MRRAWPEQAKCEGRCWTSLEGGNRGAYRVAGLMLDGYGDLSLDSGAGNGDAGDEPMRSVDKASISAAKRCAVDAVGERQTA